LHVDPFKLFLAGDSAGSQIAGQLANIISAPVYAKEVGVKPTINRSQLRGVILFCGVYAIGPSDFEGPIGDLVQATLWSYLGTKDFLKNRQLEQLSVTSHITPEFPAIFISVGNGDPLLPQSIELAETAARLGVKVDSLFFPNAYGPALPHEYQFNLDNQAGQLALDRVISFVKMFAAPQGPELGR
jgi:acetyl esterase